MLRLPSKVTEHLAGRYFSLHKRVAWLLIPAVATALAGPVAAASQTYPYLSPKPYVRAAETETPLAQGVTLTSFERLYPDGWAKGWLLTAQLSHPALSTDLVTAPGVTEVEPLSSMAARAGAIAAVNGDFFDIGQTGIALGNTVKGGEFLQSAIPSWPLGAGVGRDQIGRLMSVVLEGSVTLPSGNYPLGAVNLPTVPSGTIGLFTPLWTRDRSAATVGATEAVEVVVRQGKVVSVSHTVTDAPVPADGFVLLGREGYAAPLAALQVGDPVALEYHANPDVLWAVGGQRYLVAEGAVTPGLDDTQRRPRTAIGFSADGSTLYLATVEGGSAASSGATLREMAELMKGFGAASAMELDGGGSSTMVARMPGTEGLTLLNRPSDGQERRIPNGVGIFAEPGSGDPHHLSVQGERRVFPGLSRTFSATALDEQYGPAQAAAPVWILVGAGALTPDGRYTAAEADGTPVASGSQVVVAAASQGLTTAARLKVLGPLARIVPSAKGGLRLHPEEGATFAVVGYDGDGFAAPIDPADLTLEYDPELIRVEREGDLLRAIPLTEGTGLITVTVQGREAVIPFAAAHRTTVLDAFADPAAWQFERYPAEITGAVTPVEQADVVDPPEDAGEPAGDGTAGPTGAAMALSYVFRPAAGNRAAYLQAVEPLALPGQPVRVGMWVKGDGQGAWLRAVLQDASGARYTVNLAPKVDWTDWRYVEADVPAGVQYPVSLYRVYPVETDGNRIYMGSLQFADLTVRDAAEMPEAPPPEVPAPDLILTPAAPAGEGSWSFAVLDAMPPVEPALVLSTALAADPAFFLVDTGLREPVLQALAELGAADLPVYEMAPPERYFDVGAVRFILLGTGQGGLRATDFSQLEGLQTLLYLTGSNETVRQVVVVSGETPLAFADRREGELIQRWLTEFEDASGKSAVYLAAGGSMPDVTRVEGIPYIEAGSPVVPRIFTIDPTPGNVWIRMGQ